MHSMLVSSVESKKISSLTHTEVYWKYTYTAGATVIVNGSMIFSTIQVSNEFLTLLAVKTNYWCHKRKSCKMTRIAVNDMQFFSM